VDIWQHCIQSQRELCNGDADMELETAEGAGGVAWPTAEAPVIADITIVEVELSVSRERIKPFLLQ